MHCSKNSCTAVHMYDEESVYRGYRVMKSETVMEMTNMALFEMVMVTDDIELATVEMSADAETTSIQ